MTPQLRAHYEALRKRFAPCRLAPLLGVTQDSVWRWDRDTARQPHPWVAGRMLALACEEGDPITVGQVLDAIGDVPATLAAIARVVPDSLWRVPTRAGALRAMWVPRRAIEKLEAEAHDTTVGVQLRALLGG
jgi:hypothetical protein